MASYLHRTATTAYLCYVPILEDSAGAGRVGLAIANIHSFCTFAMVQNGFLFTIFMRIKNNKILIISILILLVYACSNKEKAADVAFTFNGEILREQYKPTDSVTLQIKALSGEKADSVVFFLNEQRVGSGKLDQIFTCGLVNSKLGYQNIKANIYREGKPLEIKDRIEVVSAIEPKLYNYTVVNMYAHDTKSFTEGLEFYRDTLYEGTGQNGQSWLRKFDYKTGKIFKQTDLEPEYFGEGITILKDKVYQLTYRSMVGFIYNAITLKREKTFNYHKQIEGWGMTNDGKYIYHSDGTEKIWKMDPDTQKMIDYVNVYSTSGKIKSINELEYVDGVIYGNIWQKDAIAMINPANGAVIGIVNLADLRKQVGNAEAEVLNGIAYNPKTKTFFVTGKHWDKLFEIRLTAK